MLENKPMLESEFAAALTDEEMNKSELEHTQIDSLRKVSMFAGLTKSSEDLKAICNSNPSQYKDALEFGLKSYEHYMKLLPMLENALLRIYAVAAEQPSKELVSESTEQAITQIITSTSREKLT